MRAAGWTSLLAGVALAVAACGPTLFQEEASSPVITAAEVWNVYPAAQVTGALRMTHGCLVLRDLVVVWPLGTGWDPNTQSVTFEGTAVDAPIGVRFRGGGGYYEERDGRGFASLFGAASATALVTCLHRTGARGAVFAYPDSPKTS